MILQEPVVYHQDLSTIQLLFESVKTLGAVAGFWLVWYVKGVNSSLKIIESDINEIKVDLGANGANMIHMKDRMQAIEHEQKEQLRAWISHTDKYGSGLDWANRQVQKQQ